MKKILLLMIIFTVLEIEASSSRFMKEDAELLKIKAASEKIEYQIKNLYLSFLPELNISFSDNTDIRMNTTDTVNSSFNAGAQFSLYSNGKRYLEYQLLKNEYLILKIKYISRYNNILMEIFNQLISIHNLRNDIISQKKEIEYNTVLCREKKYLFYNGDIVESDYAKSVSDKLHSESILRKLNFDYNISIKSFKDKYYFDPLNCTLKKKTLPFEINLCRNFELLIKTLNIKNAEIKETLLKTGWMPKLNLYYTRKYSGEKLPYSNVSTTIGFSLTSNFSGNSLTENQSYTESKPFQSNCEQNSQTASIKADNSYFANLFDSNKSVKLLKYEKALLTKNLNKELEQLKEELFFNKKSLSISKQKLNNSTLAMSNAQHRFDKGELTLSAKLFYEKELLKTKSEIQNFQYTIYTLILKIHLLSGTILNMEDIYEIKK